MNGTMTTTRALSAVFGAASLLAAQLTAALTANDLAVFILAMMAGAFLMLAWPRRRTTTKTILQATHGLKPGDTLMAHGRNYRIIRIDGQTVTWRPL